MATLRMTATLLPTCLRIYGSLLYKSGAKPPNWFILIHLQHYIWLYSLINLASMQFFKESLFCSTNARNVECKTKHEVEEAYAMNS